MCMTMVLTTTLVGVTITGVITIGDGTDLGGIVDGGTTTGVGMLGLVLDTVGITGDGITDLTTHIGGTLFTVMDTGTAMLTTMDTIEEVFLTTQEDVVTTQAEMVYQIQE